MKIFYEYHRKKYPNMQVKDKIKLIYQSVLGPNHLGKDLQPIDVKTRLTKELQEPFNQKDNLYEWLSEEFLRINIGVYYKKRLAIDTLVDSFISSAKKIPYNQLELKKRLTEYLTNDDLKGYDYQPISHSEIYRNIYLPHYLVISKNHLPLEFKKIQLDNFLEQTKEYTITALEGKCASGKTTLSGMLQDKYTVIHMDDFFLDATRKTNDRLNEIGGNIDYELVKDNIVTIKQAWENRQELISIKVFDCTTQTYHQQELFLKNKIILEGVYSTHPYFKEQIDYVAYIYLDEKTQLARINQRKMKDMFIKVWMPLENKYFDYYQIVDNCDIII